MFTLEQIRQAHSQVKSGADFPLYIQDIQKIGVISYKVSLSQGIVQYHGKENFKIQSPTGIDSLRIAPLLNVEQFKSDLKNHQQGNTDYQTFCHDCAKSGIEKWMLNMDDMTCVYFDIQQNQVLVEKIWG